MITDSRTTNQAVVMKTINSKTMFDNSIVKNKEKKNKIKIKMTNMIHKGHNKKEINHS